MRVAAFGRDLGRSPPDPPILSPHFFVAHNFLVLPHNFLVLPHNFLVLHVLPIADVSDLSPFLLRVVNVSLAFDASVPRKLRESTLSD